MISKKYSQTLFMIFMSFGMSVIMSGVVTAVNTGISDGFLEWYIDYINKGGAIMNISPPDT